MLITVSITAKMFFLGITEVQQYVCLCVCVDFSVTLKGNYLKTNGDMNEIIFAHKLTG